MSEPPVDLMSATQEAVVALMRSSVSEELGYAWHTLKQDQKPPFNLVADITSEDTGEKDGQLERLIVETHSVYVGGDRSVLLAMMHAVRTALDRQAVTIAGVTYRIAWLSGAASSAAADGKTYAGVGSFEIYAEPA